MLQIKRLGVVVALVLCLCGLSAGAGDSGPAFAGWILSTKGTVIWRNSMQSNTLVKLDAVHSAYRRLYVGEEVRTETEGAASLLVYGRPVEITSKSGWYRLPAPKNTSQSDTDILARFTKRGGKARGLSLLETAWRALLLTDLQNPDTNTSTHIQLRVVPVKVRTDAQGKVSADGILGDDIHSGVSPDILSVGDFVMAEVRNEGKTAVYLTLMDVDPVGSITRLFPNPQGKADSMMKLPPQSGWQRIPYPYIFRIGPPVGEETFKAIATEVTVDFGPLTSGSDTNDIDAQIGRRREDENSLSYLLRIGANSQQVPSTGDWNSATVKFVVRQSKSNEKDAHR